MTSDSALEQRLEEWARWTHGPMGMAGLGYSPVCPMFREGVKSDRVPSFEDQGNGKDKTFRQLGIGERTFYNKLAIAKAAVWTSIYTRN